MSRRYKIFATIYLIVMLGLLVFRWLLDDMVTQSRGLLIYQWWSYFGDASAVATIIMLLFNFYAWRIIPGFLVLSKHYSGCFCSSYDGKYRDAEIEIEQTFLCIKIKFKTEESSSSSLVANIERINNEECLTYLYFNQPVGLIQERSPMHYGCVIFNVANKKCIEGYYFTGRKTNGYIKMTACDKVNGIEHTHYIR